MPVKSVATAKGELFFEPQLPVYVNRVYESFHLLEHDHDFVELCYVGEGAGTHYIGDRAIPVRRGDFFFIPIGITHVFRPQSAAPTGSLVVYNCIFKPDYVRGALSGLSGEAAPLHLFLEEASANGKWLHIRAENDSLDILFEELISEYTLRRPAFAIALAFLVVKLMLVLYRSVANVPAAAPSSGSRWEELLQYIRNHAEEPLSLSLLASKTGTGVRQFSRMFKKTAGMTFTEFVQRARIDKSRRYLRATDRKISDIAQSVGYQDVKFFTRLFREITGYTPARYRRSFSEGRPAKI